MNFDFPETVKIQLVDSRGAYLKMPGIFICMKLKSGSKNPYIIMLPFTDNDGTTTLLRSEASEQITSANSYFPMAYKGNINACESNVEFSLFDNRQYKTNLDKIRKSPLSKYEAKRWNTRKEVSDYLLSNKNDGWVADKVVDLSKLSHGLPILIEVAPSK